MNPVLSVAEADIRIWRASEAMDCYGHPDKVPPGLWWALKEASDDWIAAQVREMNHAD